MENTIVWADIPVTDLERAIKFYSAVLSRRSSRSKACRDRPDSPTAGLRPSCHGGTGAGQLRPGRRRGPQTQHRRLHHLPETATATPRACSSAPPTREVRSSCRSKTWARWWAA